MSEWRQLHDFWFGAPGTAETKLTARLPLWFLKDPDADAAARTQFASWLDDYAAGALESWRESPESAVALVLLLDQIPRNCFRGQAESFRFDHDALAVSLATIERGWDRKVNPLERIFLYLPIEHSEIAAMQTLSVQKFTELHDEAPPELVQFTALVLDYAVKHKEVIDRFGRYPHRNEILGRPSTTEEIEFLREPGSAF